MLVGQDHGILDGVGNRQVQRRLLEVAVRVDGLGDVALRTPRAAAVHEFRQQLDDQVGESADDRREQQDEDPDRVPARLDDVDDQDELQEYRDGKKWHVSPRRSAARSALCGAA